MQKVEVVYRPVQSLVISHNSESFLFSEKKAIKESIKRKKTQLFLKRTIDIVISVAFIILFSPVFLVTALLIKLTSKGQILYWNDRVGYRGKHFKCYKFRSMVTQQSKKEKDYLVAISMQENGLLYKVHNDERVTWIGTLIRKTSIDEFPQFFNVLKNDMSVIGPRPLVPFMLKNYPEFNEVRSMVRPGITGLWQIRNRANNTSAWDMIEHDVEYVKNINLLLDTRVLMKTPFAVLKGTGAYLFIFFQQMGDVF